MTTKYYEGMFLLDSADYAADPDGMSGMLIELIEGAGGQIAAHRPWQDGKLAYEIAGHRKGLHYLVMFTMDGQKVRHLQRACKLKDKVLRNMFLSHPKILYDATVASIQPEPAHEETPEEGAEAAPASEEPAQT